jgi:hypothetical protein
VGGHHQQTNNKATLWCPFCPLLFPPSCTLDQTTEVVMSKLEYLSPEGLRIDGRRPKELRKIQCNLGIFSKADGSAYFQQGNTKAIAAVYGPREVFVKSKALHDRAIINCEYSMATFSTGERKKKFKGDRCVPRLVYCAFLAMFSYACLLFLMCMLVAFCLDV